MQFVPRVLIAVGLGLCLAFPSLAEEPRGVFPEWTPPVPRQAHTPHAPKVRPGNNIFPGEAEIWLAKSMYNGEDEPLLDDPAVAEYINRVGQNLVPYCSDPNRKFEFIVIATTDRLAFTPGGGKVFLSVGLLRDLESEDELAGLLAHEMGHDCLRHTPKTVTRKLFWMLGVRSVKSEEETRQAVEKLYARYRKIKFAGVMEALSGIARKDEIEADSCAFYTTYKAGYNPYAVGNVLKRLEAQFKAESGGDYNLETFTQFFIGSHPPTGQRTVMLSWERAFVKNPPPKTAKVTSPAFEAMRKALLR